MNLLLGQQTSPLDQAKIAQIYAAIGKDNPSASGGLLGSILNSWLGDKKEEPTATPTPTPTGA